MHSPGPGFEDAVADIDRMVFDRLRAMRPEERLQAGCDLTTATHDLVIAGLRLRFPGASDDELQLRAAVQRYGRAFVAGFLGEDLLVTLP